MRRREFDLEQCRRNRHPNRLRRHPRNRSFDADEVAVVVDVVAVNVDVVVYVVVVVNVAALNVAVAVTKEQSSSRGERRANRRQAARCIGKWLRRPFSI